MAALAFALRLPLAVATDQIHQPDEIFQYLEQAHRLATGYGYIPWEYRFGIRSWILPGLLAVWLRGCHALHLDDPGVYVPLTKVLCCTLSLSIVYSAYAIGRSVASEAAGRLSAVFAAVWYELVYFAQKATPEVLGCYCLMGAMAYVVARPSDRAPWRAGLLCGLALVLRFQYLPAAGVLGLVALVSWKRREILVAGLALLGVVGVAGLVDRLTWGRFFASFYNYYLFNKTYGVSAHFGTEGIHYYPGALAIASLGIFGVAPLLGLRRLGTSWHLLAFASSVIGAHSLIPHKEYRCVFAAMAILLVLTAVVVSELVSTRLERSWRPLGYGAAAAVLILVSGAGIARKLPLEEKVYHNDLLGEKSILVAYRLLHREADLAGILNTFDVWGDTGGYYYLNRNVPILFPADLERGGLEPIRVVSHVVCPAGSPEIPGFRVMTTLGDLEIRKQTNPPSHYDRPGIDAMSVLEQGIDDRFQSTVTPAF